MQLVTEIAILLEKMGFAFDRMNIEWSFSYFILYLQSLIFPINFSPDKNGKFKYLREQKSFFFFALKKLLA